MIYKKNGLVTTSKTDILVIKGNYNLNVVLFLLTSYYTEHFLCTTIFVFYQHKKLKLSK